MEIKHFDGTEYIDRTVDENLRYAFAITPIGENGQHISNTSQDVDIVLTGKELKRIVELVNTFNKLQDNPAPMAGLGDMIKLLQSFGAK